MALEEKIRQLEAIAESGDELYADYEERGLQDTCGARRAKSLIEEKRQEIAWLRELQERRKEPEIIRCAECKHRFTHNCVANVWVSVFGYTVNDDFYCGLAERRPDADD